MTPRFLLIRVLALTCLAVFSAPHAANAQAQTPKASEDRTTQQSKEGTAGAPAGHAGPTVQPGDPRDANPAPGFGTGAPRGSTGAYGVNDSGEGDGALDRSDREFVEAIAAQAQTEAAIAELGEQRAQDPRVREFASWIGRQHADMTAQMGGLVRESGVAIENDLKANRTYRKLSKEKDNQFDRRFVETMIESHKRNLKRFERTAESAKDANVREFAQAHVRDLKQRVERAEELKDALRK